MKEIPMTEETRLKILQNTESKIIEMTAFVDEIRSRIKAISNAQVSLAEKNITLRVDNLIKLLEYKMFIALLILDLASAIRSYLNAKLKYEGLYSARQIIVIINEGYKKIYNFINKNEEGTSITKNRNNSFWVKNIGQIIQQDLPALETEYNSLTEQLEKYLLLNLGKINDQRNLFIHYDEHPTIVYDTLIALDIEKTFLKLIPFLDILNKMFTFTDTLIIGYKEKGENESRNFDITIDDMILKLQAFKNPKDLDFISKQIENLQNLKQMFRNKNNPNT